MGFLSLVWFDFSLLKRETRPVLSWHRPSGLPRKGFGKGRIWNLWRRKRYRDTEGRRWEQPWSHIPAARFLLGSNWMRQQRAFGVSITFWIQAYRAGGCSDTWRMARDPADGPQECPISSTHPWHQPEQRTRAISRWKQSHHWRQHSILEQPQLFCLAVPWLHMSEQPSRHEWRVSAQEYCSLQPNAL